MRTVGGVLFDGFELLDLFGPLEMFGLLEDRYRLVLVGERAGPVISNQQVKAHADMGFEDASDLDVILIPGGKGTRREVDNPAMLDWVRGRAASAEMVFSVCTGSAILAKAGLLDGMRATTNKAAFAWVSDQGPRVNWVAKARWVQDGKFLSSSGVSAGMDAALAAIAYLEGEATAAQVAHWCEYRRETDPSNDPFAAAHGLI